MPTTKVDHNDIPKGHFKSFTLSTGRAVRVWGHQVIEARTDAGEWRIVNEKKHRRFAGRILKELLDHWDKIPTTKA